MKKIFLRKKSCYVNISTTNKKELKLIFNELLTMRFYHYYFDNNKINWQAVCVLNQLKESQEDLLIFIVHDFKIAHYPQNSYINLPIFVEKDQSEITKWLEKYCDDILNDDSL